MILKKCAKCEVTVPAGKTYCEDCFKLIAQQKEKDKAAKATRYNQTRDKKYKAFYRSKEWRRASLFKLRQANYECEAKLNCCTKLAVEVHHIEPIQTDDGWNRRLDHKNLEAVCTACHNARHGNRRKSHMATDSDAIDIAKIFK